MRRPRFGKRAVSLAGRRKLNIGNINTINNNTMKTRVFPFLAAMLAAAAMGGGNINELPPVPVLPNGNITQVHPESFGLYQASKRTHKRYLRAHRLGKFKKGKR